MDAPDSSLEPAYEAASRSWEGSADAADWDSALGDGLAAVAEWEADAGSLTPAEQAAGQALLDRLVQQTQDPDSPPA